MSDPAEMRMFDLGMTKGMEIAEERIIKLLDEHVCQFEVEHKTPDFKWKQRCRCGFYGVFNEHLTALIKGEK